MIYTVVSLPGVDDELALIWMQARDRPAVTAASNRIERALKRDADRKGTLLDDGSRVYFDSPLYVNYTVSPDDRLVTILGFRHV